VTADLRPDLRRPPFVLLDDSRQGGQSLYFAKPTQLITAHTLAEVEGALHALDAAVSAGKHVAGFFAYELAAAFEPRLRALADCRRADAGPLLWLLVCDRPDSLTPADMRSTFAQAAGGHTYRAELSLTEPPDLDTWYLERVGTVSDYIQAGDIYQANLTFPLTARLDGDPVALYRRLRSNQPVAFGAYIDTGKQRILSASPELFVAKSAEEDGDLLMAKPMKGTAARGLTLAEDEAAITGLRTDAKSRAENLMIVDLLRNDLSRIAAPGSVSVPSLFDVERLPSLLQMTSTITARARSGLTPSALLAALFPCGSVTGAPKIRAVEILHDLERGPRGVYCGAIGRFGPDGWSLSVPIRTLTLDAKNTGSLHLGSGLVADSVARDELVECRMKARFAIGDTAPGPEALIESIRVEADGSLPLLDPHLDRLLASAVYFGIPAARQTIRTHILDAAAALPRERVYKLRLLLYVAGEITVSATGIEDSETPVRLALSDRPINTRDPLFRHKTTSRQLYTDLYEAARSQGCDDVIFLNENGDLAETAIHNIFLRRGDQWQTPPLSSGCLPGVSRAAWLSENSAVTDQQALRLDDLKTCDAIVVTNAVRGRRKAIFTGILLP